MTTPYQSVTTLWHARNIKGLRIQMCYICTMYMYLVVEAREYHILMVLKVMIVQYLIAKYP